MANTVAVVLLCILDTSWAVSTCAAEDAAAGTQLGPPRLDMLKDAHICPDGRGNYYLTGTAATFDKSGRVDFDHNRGVPLWRSRDLKTWENLGFAWDRVKHLARSRGRPRLGVWLQWSAPADRINGRLAQATTTPELCHVGDAWYIACAMNGQNIILQKSTSGKPEGPYEDHAYLATRGGDPSLFVDDDGEVYLVFADAWIARLKPDLSELAESPRPMLPRRNGRPGTSRLTLGNRGVNVFRHEGRYYVLAAQWQAREGRPRHDAVLWSADSLYGPYEQTGQVLPDIGPVSVFRAADGGWWAVSSLPCDGAPRIRRIHFVG
jgi:hypothetical protein